MPCLYALSLAEENNAELTLMHVLEQLEPMPEEYSKDLLADYRKRLWELVPDDANLWCKPQVVVEVGLAAESIVRKAHDRQVDLIVMGVHQAGAVANHLPWTVVHSVRDALVVLCLPFVAGDPRQHSTREQPAGLLAKQ